MANELDDNLDGNLDGCLELLVDLNPELPLDDPYNVYAAGQRGLIFNPEKGVYVDSKGSVIDDPNNHPFSK